MIENDKDPRCTKALAYEEILQKLCAVNIKAGGANAQLESVTQALIDANSLGHVNKIIIGEAFSGVCGRGTNSTKVANDSLGTSFNENRSTDDGEEPAL